MSIASPLMAAGTDIHARLAPAPHGADRSRLRAHGVPSVLRVLIENVRDRRPVVLFGEDEGQASPLWDALSDVRTRKDWEAWLASARQSAWGKPVQWSKQVEDWGLEERHEAWRRARMLLGSPLAQWLQEDHGWQSWWSSAKPRLDGNGDMLEKRTRELDGKRRKSRANPDAPWPSEEDCDRDEIKNRAHRLATRFGLRRIEAAAGMPLWCIAEHLAQAEAGLADFAKAIGWPEERIGAGHLGLGWELGPKDVAAAYDPLQHMIYLGREDWHGSFAHEFGHAIDRVAAGSSVRERKNGMYLSSQLENDPLRDDLPLDRADMVRSFQEILRGFASMYAQWRKEGPASHPQLDPLDEELDGWMARVLDPSQWSTNHRHAWDRWRSRMTLVLTNAPRDWTSHFSEICEMAERLWDNPPAMEGWRAWAVARDEAKGKNYWAQPHELWARAYHALVYSRMDGPGWAASDADLPHLHPCRSELARWEVRLDQRMNAIERAWVAKTPSPAPRPTPGVF